MTLKESMTEDCMVPHSAYFCKKELEDKHADLAKISKPILDAMDDDKKVALF